MTKHLAVALAVVVLVGSPATSYEWLSHNQRAREVLRLVASVGCIGTLILAVDPIGVTHS